MQLSKYASEIAKAINSGKVSTKDELNRFKIKISEKYQLKKMPTNPDIFLLLKKPSAKVKSLLSIKPVRSLSGVTVVAAMVAPHKCPGNCIYCPSGIETEMPKSYTGSEPASMRARMFDFDSYKQVSNRIEQLQQTGHSTEKIELIVMGGTFLSTPLSYQRRFMKGCYNAITGKAATTQSTNNFSSARNNCEKSKNRVIGITFETRPDVCGKAEINNMLSFGGTRVELGVQTLDDAVYKKINRGHTVKDVVSATSLLKDSAFKVLYHMIPGLPFSGKKKDLHVFKKLFSNENFRPDMLKLYPCLVIKGTELYDLWKQGSYTPLNTEKAAKLIAEIKQSIPKYVRVMRVQRDIPSNLVSAGVKHTNLRQFVEKEMEKKKIKCGCIRCREAGLKSYRENISPDFENIKILNMKYKASSGTEHFISAEDEERDLLYGFCRLRIPEKPFRKEIDSATALVRELHVYGTSLPLHERKEAAQQHRGFGKQLLQEAERIAAENYGMKKMLVISGLGARQYYKQIGYSLRGNYMGKSI